MLGLTGIDGRAGLVAQGLGSDHGEFDLAGADAFAAATPTVGEPEVSG